MIDKALWEYSKEKQTLEVYKHKQLEKKFVLSQVMSGLSYNDLGDLKKRKGLV